VSNKKNYMKSKIIISLFFTLVCIATRAQDFKTDISNAKTSYASGKLEEAHFALMQAMQEIDIKVGQEILKLFPPKMDTMTANPKDDQVAASSGFVGTTIHRSYGTNAGADLSVISNSPMIATLNTFLNTPMLGGMMSDGNTKVVKVQGYKSRLTKEDSGDGKTGYSLEIPLNNSLITFKVKNCTDSQILNMANSLPVQQIAKLIQRHKTCEVYKAIPYLKIRDRDLTGLRQSHRPLRSIK